MAFTQLTTDLNNHQSLPNQPKTVDGWTPTVLKELYDKAPNDVKTYINTVLLAELEGTTGAGNIGIPETIAGSGANVKARAEWLYAQILNAVLGQIPLGSLTDDKLSNTAGQIKDKVNTHLAEIVHHKLIPINRDISLTGTQTISGLPFRPKRIDIKAFVPGTNKISFGTYAENNRQDIVHYNVSYWTGGNSIARLRDGTSDVMASVANVTDTSFDLVWTINSGTPSGTAVLDITIGGHY